jgi:tetratricopeptide (TPR) repeat protein
MPIPAGLSRGWDGARRLVRACLDAETDPALLKRLGILSARLRNALLTLKQASQISENQLPDLLQKHDRLTQEIWEKLRSVDPRDQDAHHGLSLLALRQQRFPEAWTLARAGLTLHPDHPGLLAIQSFLLRLDERPREAYLQSKAAAEAGKDAALWLITAESAAVIPDRDAAIAACERALDLDPHLHYATRFLARLLREAGDPHAAVQRLRTLPEKSLFADPLTVRDYVTSLLQAGLALHLEEVFQNLEQHATSTRSSAVLAAGFLGAAESPLTATIARSLTMLSERAEKRWPEDTELTVARSALAYALAEQLEPAWDPQRTRTATTLLERARTLAPADRDTAARLTWLQLQGQTNPAEAQRAAARLRTDFAQQEVLSPFQSLVLAACERQNGNPQQALVVIQRALGAYLPSAGLWIEKAFCHHDLKNQDEARQALSNAQVLQRNGREQVEYLKAVEKLKGENR